MFFAPSKSRQRAKIWIMVISKTYDHMQIIFKLGLEGHGCSLYLQNLDQETNFGRWVHQRPVTISKSRSRCQTPIRNLQHPKKPQIRTLRTQMLFASLKAIQKAKSSRPISQSRSKCPTTVKNLQHPKKPQIMTQKTQIYCSRVNKENKIWIKARQKPRTRS